MKKSAANSVLREHRLSIGFRAALDILRDRQITHLGTLCKIDVQEEIDGYVKRIHSVMDHYLEKLPVHVDVGIIGGGGAMIKDLSGRHRPALVSEPVMANAVGYWFYGIAGSKGVAVARDFVIYRVHIHKTSRRTSTSSSKACRNPSGGSTSGKP